MNKRSVLWGITQVLAATVAVLSFFSLGPWLGTRPISEAPPEARQALPLDCPAYTVSHGTYACARRGTIEMNPIGFSINVVVFAVSVGFVCFIEFTGRGFPPSRLGPGFWRWKSKSRASDN